MNFELLHAISKIKSMKVKNLVLNLYCYLSITLYATAQTEIYYTIDNGEVQKSQFSDLKRNITFEYETYESQEALTIGIGILANKLIPLLVDGASKLFYNPDNFNKEYFSSYSFFNASSGFTKLDPNSTLVFKQTGKNDKGENELINTFQFEIGSVQNVDGYYYLGLKSYHIRHCWSKLSTPNNKINYILDLSFYYFDDYDKSQEFHLNPILLDNQIVGENQLVIEAVNYQVIPKMKILQNIQLRIREINAKTQNWNRYLEHYQNNQDEISAYLIRAIRY